MKKIPLIMIGLSATLLADFSRDSSGIVTDSITGLQWQDTYGDNGDDIKYYKWTDAITYCEALSLGGHDDWRLPNFNELYSLVDTSRIRPAMDPAFQHIGKPAISSSGTNGYWSSTSVAAYSSKAFAVDFDYGGFYNGGTNIPEKYNYYFVRCVRGGQ
jgi:hypothetical protein